ncbi:MAG: GTP cyclohydrolase I FolE [Bacteroidaceae bacterium]
MIDERMAAEEEWKAVSAELQSQETRSDEQQELELSAHIHGILGLIGENPQREGLLKTPLRVARAMRYLTSGYAEDPIAILNSAKFNEDYRQMVIVRDINFYSLCEHHMLPFYGHVHVAYIPNGQVTGLSKIPRVVDCFARRLQIQERLTKQIRECIQEALHPLGVMVVVEAQHMCMQMRGVEKQGSWTTTSDFCGAFNQAKTREEFLQLIVSK